LVAERVLEVAVQWVDNSAGLKVQYLVSKWAAWWEWMMAFVTVEPRVVQTVSRRAH
jgi:hypothetical protein